MEMGVLKMNKKPNGYWNDKGYDVFPTQRELNRLGYGSLVAAISKYHGGLPAFRRILDGHLGRETGEEQLESLLENYVSRNGREDA
jgi:hypothetical protein